MFFREAWLTFSFTEVWTLELMHSFCSVFFAKSGGCRESTSSKGAEDLDVQRIQLYA